MMTMKVIPPLIFSLVAFAQTPAPPAFEAAAIKPSNEPPGHSGMHSRTGMLVIENQTLRGMFRDAYRINENQIEGGPKWMDEDRFNVNARSAGPSEGPELRQMLQTLLADRFKVTFHRETRQFPGYVLVVAKGGMKIPPSGPGDSGSNTNTNTNNERTHMSVKSFSMGGLAALLARQLRTQVTDETGVKDLFSFELDFTQDNMSTNPQPGDPRDGPSLFTALQEKLGVKLESRKVPTEVL